MPGPAGGRRRPRGRRRARAGAPGRAPHPKRWQIRGRDGGEGGGGGRNSGSQAHPPPQGAPREAATAPSARLASSAERARPAGRGEEELAGLRWRRGDAGSLTSCREGAGGPELIGTTPGRRRLSESLSPSGAGGGASMRCGFDCVSLGQLLGREWGGRGGSGSGRCRAAVVGDGKIKSLRSPPACGLGLGPDASLNADVLLPSSRAIKPPPAPSRAQERSELRGADPGRLRGIGVRLRLGSQAGLVCGELGGGGAASGWCLRPRRLKQLPLQARETRPWGVKRFLRTRKRCLSPEKNAIVLCRADATLRLVTLSACSETTESEPKNDDFWHHLPASDCRNINSLGTRRGSFGLVDGYIHTGPAWGQNLEGIQYLNGHISERKTQK
ncbi:translation initiation factor IF-2-like [Prionailurus viverrinus]|uniref:translation initiation factor IF-2-like n=1 Tax=Prionailurus viverrinus TaxID=61388 RepID=UPI001FF39AF5|nr:translation initiation factor IF-2-like [Prionailurus viverrinus]